MKQASNSSKNGVNLQPIPYPFKSAMAISSDIDDCPPQLFERIHTYLNTEENTPEGMGLNLEIGDSLWIWSHNDNVLSLLDDNDAPRPYKKKLARLCQQGWIDSFHSMGDYNSRTGFSRDRAKLAYNLLKDMGISLDTYINHGNRQNYQNFSCRLADSYLGDDPSSENYHSDLALEYGIKFYWWDELVSTPLSCAKMPLSSKINQAINSHLKNIIKIVKGKSGSVRSSESLKELMVPYTLKDKNQLWAFTRYNQFPGDIWARPGRHSFKHQLTEKFLEKLLSEQGYAVLYTHFGQNESEEKDRLFDADNREALLRLKQRYENKDILVAATGRLLNFWVKNRYLSWTACSSDGLTEINIIGVDDPVSGKTKLEINDLQGLAFETPLGSQVRILLDNDEASGFKVTEKDNKQIAFFPWKKLDLPDQGFRLI